MKYINREKMIDAINTHMAADLADGRVGGAGICVMQEGRELYKAYFGAKRHAPYTLIDGNADGDRMIFRLASMTKPFTAVATLMQVEAGLMDLDEPVERLLPGFANMRLGHLEDGRRVADEPISHPLTPRILLSHVNGLGTGEFGTGQYADLATDTDKQDLAHMADFWSRTLMEFHPLTAQSYSPVAAFDVLARLVEITSDMPYDEFIRRRICEPCGMTDTTFAPTEEQWRRVITMHTRREENGHGISEDDANPPSGVFEDYPTTWFCGGAGLAASLPDYVRFAEMLCRRGVTADGQRILSSASVDLMGSAQIPAGLMPPEVQWGLGVRVITSAGIHLPFRSFGWSGAYGSHFWVDPDNRITAVYMKNSRYDGGAGALTSQVFELDVCNALE